MAGTKRIHEKNESSEKIRSYSHITSSAIETTQLRSAAVLSVAAKSVSALVLQRALNEIHSSPPVAPLPIASAQLSPREALVASLLVSRIDGRSALDCNDPCILAASLPKLQHACISAVEPSSAVPLACAALSARCPVLLSHCAQTLAAYPSEAALHTCTEHLQKMKLAELVLLAKAVLQLPEDASSDTPPRSDRCIAAFRLCKAWQAADVGGSVHTSCNAASSLQEDTSAADSSQSLMQSNDCSVPNGAPHYDEQQPASESIPPHRMLPRRRAMPFLLRLCRVARLPFDRFCDEVAEDSAVTCNAEANREIAR